MTLAPSPRRSFIVSILLLIALLVGSQIASANDITIEGPIDSVQGSLITVGGLVLDLSNVDDDDDDDLRVGQRFSGTIRQVNGVWVVQQITALDGITVSSNQNNNSSNNTSNNSSNNTSNNTSSDDDDDVILVIEGPIEAIGDQVITIHDIEVNITNIIITNLQIGNIVRVEGRWCDDDDDDDDDCGFGSSVEIVAVKLVNYDDDDDNGSSNQSNNSSSNQSNNSSNNTSNDNDDDDDDGSDDDDNSNSSNDDDDDDDDGSDDDDD
ncbi:MAG TPA: hypothetical protein PLQ56_16840 [Aggregatilineales bacterium]|nr:hypothetical protein [Aggregatilineales bacterium]